MKRRLPKTRPLKRGHGHIQQLPTLVFVCEGKTEQRVLESLRARWRVSSAWLKVVGEVGAPKTIVERARAETADEKWVCFDRDEHGTWSSAPICSTTVGWLTPGALPEPRAVAPPLPDPSPPRPDEPAPVAAPVEPQPTEPEPVAPRPAPRRVSPVPPTPRDPPSPATGSVRIVGDARRALLVGSSGPVEVGAVAPGSYEVWASFGAGPPASASTKPIVVRAGSVVVVSCSSVTFTCAPER